MSDHPFNGHAGNHERSGVQDEVSFHIGNMLRDFSPIPPEHTIFRVRNPLREVNEKAYEPVILAIGPYHHGNDKFKFMEEQKLRNVMGLIKREEKGSVQENFLAMINRYMPTLIELEERARHCYAEPIDPSQKNFLAMMLIDGCFIVEWFRRYIMDVRTDEDDWFLKSAGFRNNIRRDLLLLENQLPLFVLSKLYHLTKDVNKCLELSEVAIMYFQTGEEGPSQTFTSGEAKHLLHLYHTWRTSGKQKKPQYRRNYLKLISSAAELKESGVRFKAVEEEERDLRRIEFKNGTLKIPVLHVVDPTESRLRNLIAFEQHHQSRDITHFTDYVIFMDRLINSLKDVEVLRHAGIVQNHLGDDKVLAQMFNKMGDHVNIYSFCYSDTCDSVNKYCRRKRNIWMAKLRREYFHSPWALLSVVAAIVLLLLTAAQTVFAVLSYPKEN